MKARYTLTGAAAGRGSNCAGAAASRAAGRVGASSRASASSRTSASSRANALGRASALSRTVAARRAVAAFLIALATAQVALSAEPVGAGKNAAQNVGQLTYEKWCAPCHAPGAQHPGTQALDALYKGSKPAALIQRTDLTPPIVKQFVRKGVSVMAPFRKTEISDTELDALAGFLSKQK